MTVIDFPRSPRVRFFDFDRDVTLGQATRLIVAALADEGYTLTASDNGTGSAITSVLLDGIKRVIVPAHRIVPLLTESEQRAMWGDR